MRIIIAAPKHLVMMLHDQLAGLRFRFYLLLKRIRTGYRTGKYPIFLISSAYRFLIVLISSVEVSIFARSFLSVQILALI